MYVVVKSNVTSVNTTRFHACSENKKRYPLGSKWTKDILLNRNSIKKDDEKRYQEMPKAKASFWKACLHGEMVQVAKQVVYTKESISCRCRGEMRMKRKGQKQLLK